jgi:hypothetical protein
VGRVDKGSEAVRKIGKRGTRTYGVRNERMKPTVQLALVLNGLVVIVLASGITYGFTSLQVVLKREGVYGNLTPTERTDKLSLLSTIAMMCLNIGGETLRLHHIFRCTSA